MQNAAQAIATASSPFIFNSGEMALPAICYALLMNVILLTYVYFIRKRQN
jgi:BASS family bile acid:Na+ symporter